MQILNLESYILEPSARSCNAGCYPFSSQPDPHFLCFSFPIHGGEFYPSPSVWIHFTLPLPPCETSSCSPSLTPFPIPTFYPLHQPPSIHTPPRRTPCPFRNERRTFQDKTDDVKMGIRSTALLFGQHTRSVLSALSVTSVGLIGTAGYLTDTLLTGVVGIPFYAGLGVGALQLARVLRQTDFNDRTSCWKGFVGCGWSGFWIWMGAVGNYFYLMS